jgi:hypothetical protein
VRSLLAATAINPPTLRLMEAGIAVSMALVVGLTLLAIANQRGGWKTQRGAIQMPSGNAKFVVLVEVIVNVAMVLAMDIQLALKLAAELASSCLASAWQAVARAANTLSWTMQLRSQLALAATAYLSMK